MFNWRFIFDFEYLPNESKILYHTKSLFKSELIKIEPIRK
jgi:hypothetical protein